MLNGILIINNIKNDLFSLILIIVLISVLLVLYIYLINKRVRVKTSAYKETLDLSTAIQKKLEMSLENQESLTREMIAQERMASLGSMVAGMSLKCV